MPKKGTIKNGKNKDLHSKLIKVKKDKKREKADKRKERLKEIIVQKKKKDLES